MSLTGERLVFFLTYMLAELRRRRGRTILTALGLGLGVALVVVVNAVSSGDTDDAQQQVLAPLTGVGTDMSVSRPIEVTNNGPGAFGSLSPAEQNRLEAAEGQRTGAEPARAHARVYVQHRLRGHEPLSFSSAQVGKVATIDGVSGAVGLLTLTAAHLYGTVPKIDVTQAPPRGPAGAEGARRAGRSAIAASTRTTAA